MNAFSRSSMKIGPLWSIPPRWAAFALWNLNCIHPFIEGNGRTSRAACYYLICMKQGRILGGRKTVPERIRENRAPYIAGLQAADRAYEKGQYDITELAKYLEGLLKGQLTEAP
jgi:Fic family protein